jgi:hypothetical protein
MEKIVWIDRVKNEDVSQRVKKARNVLNTINRRKGNCIGHVLHRNCHLNHVIEGKVKVTKTRKKT